MFKQAYQRANDAITPPEALLEKLQTAREKESVGAWGRFYKPAMAFAALVLVIGGGLLVWRQGGMKANESAAPRAMMLDTAAAECAAEESMATEICEAELFMTMDNGKGADNADIGNGFILYSEDRAYSFRFDGVRGMLIVENGQGETVCELDCPAALNNPVVKLDWLGDGLFRACFARGEALCFDVSDPLQPKQAE